MTTYLHSSTWESKNYTVGKEYLTDWQESMYWLHKKHAQQNQVFDNSIVEILKLLSDGQIEIQLLDQVAKKFNMMFQHGRYASELLKEYIFEEVRQNKFPQLPSRMKCMFAFSKLIDPKLYLEKLKLNQNTKTLIEIEPIFQNSKVFAANYTLLDCNLSTHKEMVKFAHQYWNGDNPDLLTTEILIEGKCVIRNIL
jgi:Protein of unknown function (DUF2441)